MGKSFVIKQNSILIIQKCSPSAIKLIGISIQEKLDKKAKRHTKIILKQGLQNQTWFNVKEVLDIKNII